MPPVLGECGALNRLATIDGVLEKLSAEQIGWLEQGLSTMPSVRR